MKKLVCSSMLLLLLICLSASSFDILPVEAIGTVYIRADGSIDPPTAPISTVDNITYTFTGDINDSIVIERDNIVVDGAGYKLERTNESRGIDLTGRSNVTIKNTNIRNYWYCIWLYSSSGNSISGNKITNNFHGNGYGVCLSSSSGNSISGNNITSYGYGISLFGSSNNSISGNNITSYSDGISLHSSSSYNSISGNNITANSGYGLYLDSSSSNIIFRNNFINNAQQVYSSESVNVWDDGYPSGGNYWSDYNGTDLYRGPYQNETGYDWIGDTPYTIDQNNTDRYPLMVPYVIPEFSSFLILPLFFMATVLAVIVYRRRHRLSARAIDRSTTR